MGDINQAKVLGGFWAEIIALGAKIKRSINSKERLNSKNMV